MDICVLYEDCRETVTCESCASGKKYCSIGYDGIYPEVQIPMSKIITIQLNFKVPTNGA